MSQPSLFQPQTDTTSAWSLVFGAVQALVLGEIIRDHRFGTTLDSAYLGVRKVGINGAAGVAQSSLSRKGTAGNERLGVRHGIPPRFSMREIGLKPGEPFKSKRLPTDSTKSSS